MYELMHQEKAFQNDDAFIHSHLVPEIRVQELPQILQSHLSKLLGELLDRKPERRPEIDHLLLIFKSYCILFNESFALLTDYVEAIPSYVQWQKVVSESRNELELVSRLAEICKFNGHANAAIALLKQLVSRNWSELEIQHQLELLYERKGDWKVAVSGWKDLLEKNPSNTDLREQLIKACEEKGAMEKAEKYKTKTIIAALTEMVDRHPHVFRFRDELRRALENAHEIDLAIETWKGLVEHHSEIRCLHVQLRRACEVINDGDAAIKVWEDLLRKRPESLELQNCLRKELIAKRNMDDAIVAWNQLKESHSIIGEFHKPSLCILI